jgi:hypothetical protein
MRPRAGAPKSTSSDQNKKVEIPPKPNPSTGTSSKAQQRPPYKPIVLEVKEVDRPQASFSLEHELSKIRSLFL